MPELADFRKQIDAIDNELVELLARRLTICRAVAEMKKKAGIAMMQADRVAEVKARNAERGSRLGLDPGFTMNLYAQIIDEACRVETMIIDGAARD
jgi:chorismate mutase-like protein